MLASRALPKNRPILDFAARYDYRLFNAEADFALIRWHLFASSYHTLPSYISTADYHRLCYVHISFNDSMLIQPFNKPTRKHWLYRRYCKTALRSDTWWWRFSYDMRVCRWLLCRHLLSSSARLSSCIPVPLVYYFILFILPLLRCLTAPSMPAGIRSSLVLLLATV